MDKKLLSVIIPVYNGEKTIRSCLDSVLQQTYSNIEIIVIDDGSSDQTKVILDSYAKKFETIKFLSVKNQGVSSARNYGLNISQGEFITFLDADDNIRKDAYKILMKTLIENNTSICCLINKSIYKSNLANGVTSSEECLNEFLQLKFPTSVWAYVYERKVIENIRFDESIHFFEDFLFNYFAISNVRNISIVDEDVYIYNPSIYSVNGQSLNDRKISCLKIYEMLYFKLTKKQLEYSQKFRSHFLLSMILCYSKGSNKDRKYKYILKNEAQKMFIKVNKSKYVPIRIKIVITLMSISSRITTKMIILLNK